MEIEGWLAVAAIVMSGYQLLLWRRLDADPPAGLWRELVYLDNHVAKLLQEPHRDHTSLHDAYQAVVVAADRRGQFGLRQVLEDVRPLIEWHQGKPPIPEADLQRMQTSLRDVLHRVRRREIGLG